MTPPPMTAALDLAESSRQAEWQSASFVAELFKGNFRWDLIHPYPTQSDEDAKIGDALLAEMAQTLKDHVNPGEIDRTGDMPKSALKALADKGYFGLKIPKEYGGMGISVYNYARAMELIGAWCGSTAVWLSAHQSIGVPQPLAYFGTEAQKKKYLPMLAKGAISAFALTERGVGSDPAQMQTSATPMEDGSYLLNGEKLYITNGPAADLLIVMAVTPPKMVRGKERKQISAFIVEKEMPGFEIIHRCSFMGLKGIQNGVLRFTNVKVPADNLIGQPGDGLRIALRTLNTGRLTIPAVSTGAAKVCLRHLRPWIEDRVQWGSPIGHHQEIEFKMATMLASTFAMESACFYTAALADQHNRDIRLEAAMAKYFASEEGCRTADDALQIRGGRGYETEESLKARNEDPFPIERMVRDLRINRIIEGTSEIMRLFIAREAMDFHVKPIMAMMTGAVPQSEKLKIFAKQVLVYAGWYPKQYLPSFVAPTTRYLSSANRGHLGFVQSTAKRLARSMFHTIVRYQQKLEKEQLILGHFVDIGTDLFAMAASLSRAEYLLANGKSPQNTQNLVDLFCQQARLRIERHFELLSQGNSKLLKAVTRDFMADQYGWMITDIVTD